MYIYTYLCISIINKGYIYLHVYYNVHKSLVPRWFFESVARIGNILYDLIPTYTNVQYMYICMYTIYDIPTYTRCSNFACTICT